MSQDAPKRPAGATEAHYYHRVVGIDLGTTYSAAATMNTQTGDPEIIKDPVEGATTPSVVSFDHATQRVIVGSAAKRNRANNPFDTIVEVKRQMGEHFSTEALMLYDPQGVGGFRPRDKDSGFPGDPVRVQFHGGWYLPQEISAFTLMKMKDIAESASAQNPIIDAVITVPAYFTGKQRKATEEAALLAGLYPRQLIAEPTAAAICYGLDQYEEERKVYLVYDLGGGTFDVSIIVVENNDIQIVATHGDPRLGGADFDASIMEWAVEELAQKHQLDIRNDQRSKEIVKFHAEALKIDLSTFESADMTMPELRPENPPTLTLERKRFQELIAEVLEKSLNYTNIAIEIAEREKGVPRDQIDAILLVGGSSKIPYVKERLLEHFGRDESFVRGDLDPDAVVARGAAIVAKRYEASESFDVLREIDTTQTAVDDDDPIIHHITEHSLGVGARDEHDEYRMSTIVSRGTNIPVSQTKGGFTNKENAAEIVAEVFQGESDFPAENELIGRVTIPALEHRPAGYHNFEVTFSLDHSGLLTASVHHVNSGQRYSVQCANPTGVGGKDALKAMREKLLDLYRPPMEVAPPPLVDGGARPVGLPAPLPTGSVVAPPPVDRSGANTPSPQSIPVPDDAPTADVAATDSADQDQGANPVLVVPTAEAPADLRRLLRRAEKYLRKNSAPQLLSAFNAFASALNAGVPEEELEDLADDLESAYFDARSAR